MKRCSFTCALALAATIFAGNANAQLLDNSELSLNPVRQAKQIEVMIVEVFSPLESKVPGIVQKAIRIANCESNLQHLHPDGSLKENPDPKSSAAGVFQVLLKTHRPDYERAGLDPRNAPDNIMFSRMLVERKLRKGRPPFEDWVCA